MGKDPGSRQAVKDRFHRGAAIVEGDSAKDAGIHELHPFPKFSILETVLVGNLEVVPCLFHGFYAVHPEDGWKFRFLFFVGHQVEIEFGEKEGHRLSGVLFSVPSCRL